MGKNQSASGLTNIIQYDNEAEAQAKADELQAADTNGRKYRVVQLS